MSSDSSAENTEQPATQEEGGEAAQQQPATQEEGGEAAQQQPATQEEGGEAAQQQPQQQARPSGWQIARSVLFQIVIFYFISSLFRGRQQPSTGPDGNPVTAAQNLFLPGQEMELYVYVTESADFDLHRDREWLVWTEELKYGNWKDGPSEDGTRQKTMNLEVPESVQRNGSWHLHFFLVKFGYPLDPEEEEYSPQAVVYSSMELTKYRKRRIHQTKNLLTGEAEIAPGSIPLPEGGALPTTEIISYYHPNLTINLVDDQLLWTPGSVPQPLDKHIVFDEETGNYFPVLYFNDYWNLAQDYMPMNETTPYVDLSLVFAPITLFKFNMYCSVSKENPWSQMMGGSDPTDEDQDTVKQTLMETNPYLLGLTVVVSIVHSIFEFLAFKNDVQFWRSRKSLEGLSVRSVFFNVFQSFVVLLYILDNETNTVVIISIFVGLCIELWKVTKVVDIKVDRENMIAGFIPRITYVDQPSYASSTREYDRIAFKYLGCVLFPLFICYAIYSLLYLEHKGWYSFVLSMSYGFLLTFGFITMTPQLFINYKLKSVAHLPWRMLTYKALNTFIDDMFAFVIKMPTMYRIGCFRDDIVFFIFVYQRWIYRVDPTRVNEFGTTGEDTVQQTQGDVPMGEISQGPPDSNQTTEASSTDEEVKSEEDKKND